MDVQLKLSTQDDAHIIKNLWPLYQHEVSEFDGQRPNAHGLFGVDDSVTTLAEHGESQNAWWTDPKSLFPYLILADGHPAGFNLIAARSRLPEEFDVDFVVYEFFVLHAFRGHGVAERAALDGFARHPGKWEIVTYPSQARAISFWRKVVKQVVGMGSAETDATERVGDHPWGRKVIFTLSLKALAWAYIPSCDQTGVPFHFHSSITFGSTWWTSRRISAIHSPRQSVRPAMCRSMRSDALIRSSDWEGSGDRFSALFAGVFAMP